MLLGPSLGADVEEWERMVDLNVMGLLYCAHAALPHLLRAAEHQRAARSFALLPEVDLEAGRVRGVMPSDLMPYRRGRFPAARAMERLADKAGPHAPYLASQLPPSPLLHFWSLAVEEQFYFVWPGFLMLLVRYLRISRRGLGVVNLFALIYLPGRSSA